MLFALKKLVLLLLLGMLGDFVSVYLEELRCAYMFLACAV